MRVFDIYWFNIADKVKFKDTQPYLKNMLAEFGFTWSDLAFSAQNASDDSVIARIQQKFPKLEKYFRSTKYGSTLCSYTDNRFNGELFAEKSDYDDIFTLFSKVPRPFNISSGHILLNGVNWFGEEPAAPVSDCTCEEKGLIYITDADYFSNHIAQHRNYDDGLKYNRVSVCIETTAVPEPRDSSTVIEKLIPYLGKPYWSRTHCVFSKEESLRNKELSGKHSEYIKNLIGKLDIIKPSEVDAERIFGPDTPENHVDKFIQCGAKLVIMTLGKDGAIVSDGNETIKFETLATEVVDTTGAGDAFWGGFYTALTSNYPLKEALNIGFATSAFKLRHVGAIAELPSIKELKTLYNI